MKIPILLTWKTLAGAAAFALLGALAVGWSGLVSVAANTGHFAPVEWFLHWTLRNAVATQSLTIAVPKDVDLADARLVRRAAGHFATGCAPCHGAPGIAQTAEFRSMTPLPPRLETKVGEWRDRELFWIGQHGIKYSGMPSWATQHRPDEVWAMVAFLRALPGMKPETYRDLALGGPDGTPAPVGQASAALSGLGTVALADCARCHGRDGGTGGGAFPAIGGQPEAYLRETLTAYAEGRRESGFMQPAATRYPPEILAELAAHYARQPAQGTGSGAATPGTAPGLPETPQASTVPDRPAPSPMVDAAAASASRTAIGQVVAPSAGHGPPYDRPGLLALGESLARTGLPDQKIPACETCHGDGRRAADPLYPRLAGQPAWYLSTHLHLWKEGHRGGTAAAPLMTEIAIHLTDEQIEALSLWYEGQPAGN
ncbi:cytochrome c [Aureimonas endophytica]|uniref:Cytochrome c n=1 Tax=Aureimonas endophytica TaxID=2027858 RepID=A0A917E7V4_9HYPH|nr:c-type cytochrome [Aureimonas endophytica]GGE07822.1 cytochrome c [Aureimonas endophytica]